MNVTDRDDGDAGDGDDEFAVFLDALDVAFGACVDTAGHAHAVARVVLGRVGAEVLRVAAGVGGGDEDEGAHLVVADGAGLALLGLGVVHEVLVVVVLEADEPLRGAADEEERGDELLLDVLEATGVEFLDGVDGEIALHSRGQQGLEVDDPVVEHLEGVPVESVRGWFDQMWVGHGVRRTFLLLPGLRMVQCRAVVRIGGIGPRGCRVPIQESFQQSLYTILSRILYKYKYTTKIVFYQNINMYLCLEIPGQARND